MAYNPLQEDENHDGTGDHCDGMLHFMTYHPPDGYLDIPYSCKMTAIGGVPPYYWTMIGGDMPYGCQFNGDSVGTVTGTPSYKSTYYFTIVVRDNGSPVMSDTQSVSITITDLPATCGDANQDYITNVSDAVYLVNYIFSGGPAPNPLSSGNVNCDQVVNISDAVYLIQYIFAGGSSPCAACLK
jgi:hypothetical protein